MKVKELLPIGSVVRLKEAKKELMIIGIKVVDANGDAFDYISVMYPEGYISREIYFKFNHNDIDEVFFQGYQADTREKFLKNVEKILEKSEGSE